MPPPADIAISGRKLGNVQKLTGNTRLSTFPPDITFLVRRTKFLTFFLNHYFNIMPKVFKSKAEWAARKAAAQIAKIRNLLRPVANKYSKNKRMFGDYGNPLQTKGKYTRKGRKYRK